MLGGVGSGRVSWSGRGGWRRAECGAQDDARGGLGYPTLNESSPPLTIAPTLARTPGSIGTMAGPLLFAFSLPQLWIWMALRQLQGVLDHIGIDCPFDPLHYIPGVGGTVFHDDHHRVFTKNYASCFSVIDDGEYTYPQPHRSTTTVEPCPPKQPNQHPTHPRDFTGSTTSVFGTRYHPEESELERVRGEKAAAASVLGLGSVG